MGFTAVGHLTPFLDEPRDVPYFKTHVDKMKDAIDSVHSFRQAFQAIPFIQTPNFDDSLTGAALSF